MQQPRFTRLANAFSKKQEAREACRGGGPLRAYYNLCRVHEALRITPAMQIGVTDHVWTISELVDTALGDTPETGGRRYGRFRVIDGGAK